MTEIGDLGRLNGQLRERLATLETSLSQVLKESDAKIAVLESMVDSLQKQVIERIQSSRESIALALTAAEKTTSIAQQTADKAMAKADAKADMVYLESQIRSLKDAFQDQISAQEKAITAALNASQSALKSALDASEKAITKAEEANEKRFQAVNEFRAQLGDQQKTFATRDEVTFKFQAVEKKLDEMLEWQRRMELKFADYLPIRVFESSAMQLTDWRRQVDAALTTSTSGAQASKSTVQTGRENVSMIVSVVAVLIALAVAAMKFP